MKEVYYAPLCNDVWTAPGVTQAPNVMPLIYGAIDPRVGRQFTQSHGRNITLNPNNTMLPIGNFTVDEFGNHYNAVSIKGGLCQDPYVTISTSEPSGVTIRGMQDASVFERTRKASRFLRDNGILAEYVCMQARPKYFPAVGCGRGSKDMITMPLRPFKKHLLDYSEEKGQFSASDLVKDRLSSISLGLTVRAFMTPARTEDAYNLEPRTLRSTLKQAILALQKHRTNLYPTLDHVKELNPNNNDHQLAYMSSLLPQLIGEGYGALHSLDVVHTWPHEGNITLAAEIADTDSVAGQGLFNYDDKIGPAEIINDLSRLTDGQLHTSSILHDGKTILPTVLRSYEKQRRSKMSTVESLLFDVLCNHYIADVICLRPEDKYKRSCMPKSKEAEAIDDFNRYGSTSAYHIIIENVERYLEKNKLPSHINYVNLRSMLIDYEKKRLHLLHGRTLVFRSALI